MELKNLLNKKITVTQVKGGSKLSLRQKGNLVGLGLRGIGSSSKLVATNPVIGMIKKVSHLLKVGTCS